MTEIIGRPCTRSRGEPPSRLTVYLKKGLTASVVLITLCVPAAIQPQSAKGPLYLDAT